MMYSLAVPAKVLLVLVLVPALPRVCHGDAALATKDDIASLSSLLRELWTPGQSCAQQSGWQERVAALEATLRSTEATVNRLLDENAHVKASLSLIEEMISQHSQLQDMRKRLSVLEASPKYVGGGGDGDVVVARPTECSPPFTEVMGRCVFADPSVSGLWKGMRQHCQDMGADMVVLNSADFIWHLVRHLKETHRDTVDYWVGGHRTNTGGVFHWVDGTPVKTGTPFWGHLGNFQNQQPYDNAYELGICMWRKQFYFLHSCGNGVSRSVICQSR